MTTTSQNRERSTHAISVTHLVFGLLFLGAAGVWALAELDLVEFDGARWIVPLVFVAAGAIGLVVTVGNALRGRRPADQAQPSTTSSQDADREDTEVLG